jgi:hypothetical protein
VLYFFVFCHAGDIDEKLWRCSWCQGSQMIKAASHTRWGWAAASAKTSPSPYCVGKRIKVIFVYESRKSSRQRIPGFPKFLFQYTKQGCCQNFLRVEVSYPNWASLLNQAEHFNISWSDNFPFIDRSQQTCIQAQEHPNTIHKQKIPQLPKYWQWCGLLTRCWAVWTMEWADWHATLHVSMSSEWAAGNILM